MERMLQSCFYFQWIVHQAEHNNGSIVVLFPRDRN